MLGRTNLRLFIEKLCVFNAMEALIFVNNRSDDNHAELYTAEIYRKTWEKLVAQVDDGNDMGMMSKISLVKKYRSNLPEYVEILQEQSQYGMEDPQVEIVFSTFHKFTWEDRGGRGELVLCGFDKS